VVLQGKALEFRAGERRVENKTTTSALDVPTNHDPRR